ncbi:NAD(P)-dependent dehydrogenase (short-subunit alcohol dehydrogenase family) [Nocardia tenerifensis]|uniref:NAD(P)-dependent dehydrogenase (Short-subunit alcohol dehydrogenase family) n=1 Tax=Nocardia tenerifensis TaxID=228006 RepID=A0A318JUM2_9NOCA|nr:SDR family oxidoreductase [Nocardia tenerifensis]PXX55632.1 NAD(P)-dependent dehydrogenase (short-subunit alcohol dehydrogenase family) [Nocardia tenerifensis]
MTDSTAAERVVIVGGSSGMGLALATALVEQGAEVVIAGRSADRLADAERSLPAGPGKLRSIVADIASESDIERLFGETGLIDHVVTTAVDVEGVYQPIASFDLTLARKTLDAKLIGPALLAKHARITPGGSLTFTSGIAAYRPGPGSSIVAAANGALASLAYALAVEMGPTRVNVVSPGWIDTPIWDTIAGAAKTERHQQLADRLPVGRIGQPAEVAAAMLAVMRNPFITGTVLHVDGGQRLV